MTCRCYLALTILVAWQLRDGQLSQADSVLLLLGLLALLIFQIVVGLREESNKKENGDNIDNSKAETAGLSRGLASLLIGHVDISIKLTCYRLWRS